MYKVTNKINGKFYIGKHQTKDLDDGYMGSGKLIRSAIKKYGIENFTKEILHILPSEDEMNQKEKELVVLSEMSYNLCEGGKGGFGYLNTTIWQGQKRLDHNRRVSGFKKLTFEQRSSYAKENVKNRVGIHAPDYVQEKRLGPGTFTGKKHTEESKHKIGEANSIHQSGTKNSQYGTVWITNGSVNKKIVRNDLDNWIELGYRKGRV
jgi:hypothetical protein